MKTHTPSEELFISAEKFKAAALWDHLSEMQLFAVRSGLETLYCCVLGKIGLVVYPGQKGFLSYLKRSRLIEAQESSGREKLEVSFSEDCVKCTFENRKTLTDSDYSDIVERGRTYRGKNAWPQFRRYRPLRFPWRIDKRDERILIGALKAAVFLAEELKDQSYWKMLSTLTGKELNAIACLTDDSMQFGEVPLITPHGASFKLSAASLPNNIDEHFTVPLLPNKLEIARLRKSRFVVNLELQCTITCLPMSIKAEDGSAPSVPLVFMMVEVQDKPEERLATTAALELAYDYEGGVGAWMSKFCEYIAVKGKPRSVIVNDYRADHLLRKICSQLGIRFAYHDGELPELDDMVDGLRERILAGKREA